MGSARKVEGRGGMPFSEGRVLTGPDKGVRTLCLSPQGSFIDHNDLKASARNVLLLVSFSVDKHYELMSFPSLVLQWNKGLRSSGLSNMHIIFIFLKGTSIDHLLHPSNMILI